MTPSRIILLLVGIPSIVLGLSNFPVVTFALLAALATFTLRSRTDRTWTRLFVLAALFGTVGEAMCVYGTWWTRDGRGLWVYAFPSPFGWDLKLPIWLPLVWGNLFVLFAGIADRISPSNVDIPVDDGTASNPGAAPSNVDIPVDDGTASNPGAAPSDPGGRWREGVRYILMLVIVAYAGVLYRIIDVRILWLFTPFFAAFVMYWNRSSDLTQFLVAAILGTLGEILAMRQGLWVYTMPVFVSGWTEHLGVKGIPMSLPMAWGLSSVFLTRLARRGFVRAA